MVGDYIPHGVRLDTAAEQPENNPLRVLLAAVRTVTPPKQETYRFSDVVRAINSTPKSFRRWLTTLEIESEGGGWHTFKPAQVVEFAIMRHLVNWGVPVPEAADLAAQVMGALLADADPLLMELEEFDAKVKASDIPTLTLRELIGRLSEHEVFVHRLDDNYWLEYPTIGKKGLFGLKGRVGPKKQTGAFGSYLTLSLGFIALHAKMRLDGEAV